MLVKSHEMRRQIYVRIVTDYDVFIPSYRL